MTKPLKPELVAPVWERQPAETDVGFEAFVAYRDLGPKRSQEKVATILGKRSATLGTWAVKNQWVERSCQWDAHIDRHRAKGMSIAAENEGERWMRERSALMDREILLAREMHEAACTIIRSIAGDDAAKSIMDGKDEDSIVLALRQKKDAVAILASASAIAKDASALGWGAVNTAIGDLVPASPAGAAPGPEVAAAAVPNDIQP